jgi:acetyltransferase
LTIRNLDFLFQPKSVAVIGASDRPHSVGATVMANLTGGGFNGPIWPVNPRRSSVAGRTAFRSVADLPMPPDLGVICAPPDAVPGIVAELGQRGTRAAVVLTGGLARERGEDGRTLTAAMLDAARPYLLRVLGPNCVGLIVPRMKLNATFASGHAIAGNIAFVSQSGALTTGMLDWATTHRVGFSYYISLGDGADVDFGDILDFLGSDPDTRAILLYMESITAARKFMSAARAAARNKPVIAVKAGKAPEGARAAASHTGALAGSDDVYDAALARAGILRVVTTLELFDAAETLEHVKPLRGNRLAILTNGGGPGVMATDAVIAGGGRLATLGAGTMRALDAALPATWSHGNPVDIIGDAPVTRYVAALEAMLQDPESDAVLFIHAPTAIVPSADIARACAPVIKKLQSSVFACWLGGESVREANAIFHEAGVPTFDTPEDAARGFLQMVKYRHSQDLIMEVPPSAAEEFVPDAARARKVIDAALAQGRSLLNEIEAKELLSAYGIAVIETRPARDLNEAGRVAEQLQFPVALKIISLDISHKSDVGGVALNLNSNEDVRAAGAEMLRRCAELRPDARLTGFSVQPMVKRGGAHELIVGTATDAVFGPVILFGQGGTAVEVIADKAVALPPLNLALARDLISRTRVAKLLNGYRDHPAADCAALELALVKVSQLVIDQPDLVELDINPLLADAAGIVALDARARVAKAESGGSQRLSIRPYPGELEERITFDGRPVLLRPIRPEDEPQHREFLGRIEADDMQFRFFHIKHGFAHSELARFTQIDYDRDMAFIATATSGVGGPETLGVARAMADPDNVTAEFAILIRSDLKGKGLGRMLLSKLIRYCRERGTLRLTGEVLLGNKRMLALGASCGFKAEGPPRNGVVSVSLALASESPTLLTA